MKDVPSEMITHEIGIFGEINSLESKPSETLPPVDGFILGGGGATGPWLRAPVSVHAAIPLCCLADHSRHSKVMPVEFNWVQGRTQTGRHIY